MWQPTRGVHGGSGQYCEWNQRGKQMSVERGNLTCGGAAGESLSAYVWLPKGSLRGKSLRLLAQKVDEDSPVVESEKTIPLNTFF